MVYTVLRSLRSGYGFALVCSTTRESQNQNGFAFVCTKTQSLRIGIVLQWCVLIYGVSESERFCIGNFLMHTFFILTHP